jgi:hypothetical protein
MGQLRDTSATVDLLATRKSIPSTLYPSLRIWHLGTPILNTAGSTPSINESSITITPSSLAQVFCAERLTVPKLLAIVDPGWGKSRRDSKFHYHPFFPPPPL